MSRMIVHADLHDEMIARLEVLAKSLSVGPAMERREFGANMGAMVSETQRDRAIGLIQGAVAQGAELVTGGHKLNRPGWFLEPTILDKVTPDMTIATQEVFGPVLSVMTATSEKQAIEIANSTPYGLVNGIFTSDIDSANRAARDLRSGQVFINEWFAGGVETPFGGYGQSGYGREKGREALWNYLQTKNIATKIG